MKYTTKNIICSTLILFLLFFSVPSYSQDSFQWSSSALNVERAQGTLSIHTVTVNASDYIEGAAVRITPELLPWVSVSPSSLGSLHKGQAVNIILAFNTSPNAKIGLHRGAIELRQHAAGKPYSVIAKPLPITLTISPSIKNKDLPPDPGPAGKKTLLGNDIDLDGVRDDIQRYIHYNYNNDKKVQLAVTEVAKQFQLLLLESNDPNAVFNNATKMARHGECLDYIKGEAAADILAALQAEILNTKQRSLAYIKYKYNLSGESILGRPLKDWKRSCSFDVDAAGQNN